VVRDKIERKLLKLAHRLKPLSDDCVPVAYLLDVYNVVFTALHGMQTRSSDENSVCVSVRPSICLSVTRVNCDKTVERSVQIFIPYERSFSLVF